MSDSFVPDAHLECPRQYLYFYPAFRHAKLAVDVKFHRTVGFNDGMRHALHRNAACAMRGTHSQVASVPEPRQQWPVFDDHPVEHPIVELSERCDAGAASVFASVGEGNEQRMNPASLAVELNRVR